MLKRMWAIVLSVTMLVTLCPTISVFAADTKPVAIVEDFEDGAVDSSIVDLTADKTVTRTVVDLEGGGKALKITNLMDDAGIGFNVTYGYAANVSVLTYDIQVSKAPTTGGRSNHMVIGGTSAGGGAGLLRLYRSGDGETAFTFRDQSNNQLNSVIVGKWYTIVMVRYYNKAEVWVIDENGNIVANHSRTSHANSQTGYLLLQGNTNILDDGEILIDNINFNLYSRDFGPSLMSDTLAETDVPLSTNSVTVTFDQPLDNLSATLTPDGGSATTCTMEAKKDANGAAIPLTYVASWDSALASNTNYTLDFTGSNTKQGTSSRTIYVDNTGVISFTTETVAAPALMSSTIAKNAVNVPKNIGTVTVSFDQPLAQTGASLTPAGGSAIACAMTAGDEANTYVVTLPTLKGDTTYTLGFATSKNAAGVPVSDTISFTTEAASIEETVITDNFEDATEFSGNFYDSDQSKPFSNKGASHGAFAVAGYGGSGTAAEIRYDYGNASGTRATFYSSSSYTFNDENAVVVNYKMKISNAPSWYDETEKRYVGGNRIFIGTNTTNADLVKNDVLAVIDMDYNTGVHYIGLSAGQSKDEATVFTYKEDKWYNATFTVDGGKETFSLTDIDTGELLFTNSKEVGYKDRTATYIGLVAIQARQTEETNEKLSSAYWYENGCEKDENGNITKKAAVTIDDIALWTVDTSKATHALTVQESSVEENVVTLTFNQPTMATAEMFAVSFEDNNDKNDDVATSEYEIDVKYTGFNTNVVTISGLNYDESYYLDYSAVKSAGGAGFDPDGDGEPVVSLIQFKMPKPTTSVMDNAEYDADGSVLLDYWAMGGESTGRFIAAFYEGTTLVKVAVIPADMALSADKNTVKFTAANVPANANGMIVYALNSLGSLVPLCAPTAKVAIN